jgi:hypothetical protein
MKEALLQIKHNVSGSHHGSPVFDCLVADEGDNVLKNFRPNQIVSVKIQGIRKERSLDQLKLWWGVCTYCSEYMGVQMLDSKRKMSDYVLIKTNHVEFSLMINGVMNMKPVSVSYAKMEHLEACGAFNDGLDFMCIDMMNSTVEQIIEELKKSGKYKGKYKPEKQTKKGK